MAEIYLAASQGAEGFEKEVVIKRVRSFLATDPGFVDMFIAEARLASQLNHANVVQIFDFAKHEDTYYLAMEYVRGCSLRGPAQEVQGADGANAARAGGAHRRGGRARACTTPTGSRSTASRCSSSTGTSPRTTCCCRSTGR